MPSSPAIGVILDLAAPFNTGHDTWVQEVKNLRQTCAKRVKIDLPGTGKIAEAFIVTKEDASTPEGAALIKQYTTGHWFDVGPWDLSEDKRAVFRSLGGQFRTVDGWKTRSGSYVEKQQFCVAPASAQNQSVLADLLTTIETYEETSRLPTEQKLAHMMDQIAGTLLPERRKGGSRASNFRFPSIELTQELTVSLAGAIAAGHKAFASVKKWPVPAVAMIGWDTRTHFVPISSLELRVTQDGTVIPAEWRSPLFHPAGPLRQLLEERGMRSVRAFYAPKPCRPQSWGEAWNDWLVRLRALLGDGLGEVDTDVFTRTYKVADIDCRFRFCIEVRPTAGAKDAERERQATLASLPPSHWPGVAKFALAPPSTNPPIAPEQTLITDQRLHLGHADPTFGLDSAQRRAVRHVLNLPRAGANCGRYQAVVGPPGTGKTRLLRDVIADVYVSRVLDDCRPPRILVAAATNQAAKNVVEAAQIAWADPTKDPLRARWIPSLPDIGWYCLARSNYDNEERLRDVAFAQLIGGESTSTSYPIPGLRLDGLAKTGPQRCVVVAKAAEPFGELFNHQEGRTELVGQVRRAVGGVFGKQISEATDWDEQADKRLRERAGQVRAELAKRSADGRRLGQLLSMGRRHRCGRRAVDRAVRRLVLRQRTLDVLEQKYRETLTTHSQAVARTKRIAETLKTYHATWWIDRIPVVGGIVAAVRRARVLLASGWDIRGGLSAAEKELTEASAAAVVAENALANARAAWEPHKGQRAVVDEALKRAREWESQVVAIASRLFALQVSCSAQADESVWSRLNQCIDQGAAEGSVCDAVEAWLDVTCRNLLFHLCLRIGEVRFAKWLSLFNDADRPPPEAADIFAMLSWLAPVVASTSNNLPRVPRELYGNAMATAEVLIIDEAGQLGVPSVLSLASLADQVVAVGDVHQLKPVDPIPREVYPAVLDRYQIEGADRELIAGAWVANGSSGATAVGAVSAWIGPAAPALTFHYRCLDPIIEMSNILVYRPAGLTLTPTQGVRDQSLPMLGYVFHDSAKSRGADQSWCNEGEADRIATFVAERWQGILQIAKLSEFTDLPSALAILTPFADQPVPIRNALRRAFARRGLSDNTINRVLTPSDENRGLTINTVHSLQGAERPVVIMSMVTDEAKSRFIEQDPSLLNVAVSRAKRSFLVFQHWRVGTEGGLLGQTRTHMRVHGRRLWPDAVMIVESPTKQKTLSALFGSRYAVYATGGTIEQPLDARPDGSLVRKPEIGRFNLQQVVQALDGVRELILALDDDGAGDRIAAGVVRMLAGRFALPAVVTRAPLGSVEPQELRKTIAERRPWTPSSPDGTWRGRRDEFMSLLRYAAVSTTAGPLKAAAAEVNLSSMPDLWDVLVLLRLAQCRPAGHRIKVFAAQANGQHRTEGRLVDEEDQERIFASSSAASNVASMVRRAHLAEATTQSVGITLGGKGSTFDVARAALDRGIRPAELMGTLRLLFAGQSEENEP